MSTTYRDPRLLALLGAPEQDIEPRNEVPGLLEEGTPDQLEDALRDAFAASSVGDLLQKARQGRGLSLREAARAAGRSPSRIVAVERATTDINVETVVQMARSLGYRVEVVLTPLKGDGERLAANLELPEELASSAEAGKTLLQGSARIPLRKARVEQ